MMSYFIANTITIDWKNNRFKVKGGDNNIVPRSNEWSSWIDTKHLLRELVGGNIQWGRHNDTNNEKHLRIKYLVAKYDSEWGGEWSTKTDLWHCLEWEDSSKIININNKFLSELKELLKGYTERKYVVKFDYADLWVSKNSKRYARTTRFRDIAKKFGEYQAKKISNSFSNTIVEKY